MKTQFEILEVPEDADDGQIKKAYLDAVRRYPPERYPEQFQRIRAAFELVATEKDRLRYMLFDTSLPDVEEIVGVFLESRDRKPLQVKDNLRELLVEGINDYCKNFDL